MSIQEDLKSRRGRLPKRSRRPLVGDFANDFAEAAPILDADAVDGTDKAADKIADYLEDIHDSPEIEGDVTIRLTQLGMGAKTPVDSWVMKQEDDYVEQAETVVARAVDDILDVGIGKVKYEVRAFIESKPLSRRVGFTLEIDRDLDDGVDEPADHRGLVSQAMRHIESKDKLIKDLVVTVTNTLRAQLHDTSEEMRDMRKNDIESRKIFGEMMQQKTLQEIEVRRFDRNETRKDQVLGKLANVVLPALAGKLMGPGVAEKMGGTPPIEDLFQGMVKGMTPDQLNAIFGLLNPDQQAAFGEIMKAAIERQEARERAEGSSPSHVSSSDTSDKGEEARDHEPSADQHR